MQITVNGTPWNLPEGLPPTGVGFKRLMESLAPQLQQQRLLVTGVLVNGEDVTGRERAAVDELGALRTVDVHVHRPEDLVSESLRVTAEMVGPLRRDLALCADQLRIGDEATATLVLFRIIDNFELLRAGVTQMGRILREFLPDEAADLLTAFPTTFEPVLDEVISAQENRDLILLADLLEYELSERLETWAAAIAPLCESLEKVDAQ
jgi:hypothetical protein